MGSPATFCDTLSKKVAGLFVVFLLLAATNHSFSAVPVYETKTQAQQQCFAVPPSQGGCYDNLAASGVPVYSTITYTNCGILPDGTLVNCQPKKQNFMLHSPIDPCSQPVNKNCAIHTFAYISCSSFGATAGAGGVCTCPNGKILNSFLSSGMEQPSVLDVSCDDDPNAPPPGDDGDGDGDDDGDGGDGDGGNGGNGDDGNNGGDDDDNGCVGDNTVDDCAHTPGVDCITKFDISCYPPPTHGGGSGEGDGDGDGKDDVAEGKASNDCKMQPESKGDPQLAAILDQLWYMQCYGDELKASDLETNVKSAEGVTDSNDLESPEFVDKTPALSNTVNSLLSRFNDNGSGAGYCPFSDFSHSIMGQSVTLEFSMICVIFPYIRAAVMMFAYMFAGVVIVRTLSEL